MVDDAVVPPEPLSGEQIARAWVNIKDPVGLVKHLQTPEQVREFANAIISARDTQWLAKLENSHGR